MLKLNEENRAGAWIENDAVTFRVYAPDRERVDVVLYEANGETERSAIELKKSASGFFEGSRRGLGAGALYKLRIDGEGPYPDPLSRSQPRGVHGPSEVIASAFAWTDAGWKGVALEDLVIYEVHVGTATPEGTFDALIGQLRDLRSLGVTALELMPIASFPGRWNWGYDGVFLYAPAAVYGGPEGLRRLINAAHAEGMAVLIDAVYNHLGPDGNYLYALSRSYFTDRHKTPWGDAWNLDGKGSGPVREVMLANAEMWIRDYHADGLRLDATHAIPDASDPHILQEIGERARAAGEGRHVVLIAEDERNEARLVTPASRGGLGLDGVWADDFHHQMRRAFAGDKDGYYADFEGTPEAIAETLRGGWYYRGQKTQRRGEPRGTPPEAIEPPSFVFCIQNHDQIGNRALGDRLSASVSPAAFRAMSTMLLLSPYTPLLFMGQEWSSDVPFIYFTDHEELLGSAVTEGRRREFGDFASFAGTEIPDPQAPATFERSKLKLQEREEPAHAGVLALYREALALRASHPCLRARGRSDFTARAAGEAAVILERRAGPSRLFVVMNIRGQLTYEIGVSSPLRVLLWSEDRRFGGDSPAPAIGPGGRIVLEGPSALVLESAET